MAVQLSQPGSASSSCFGLMGLSWREMALSLVHENFKCTLDWTQWRFCYEHLTMALIILPSWICLLKVAIWSQVFFTRLQFCCVLFGFVNISEAESISNLANSQIIQQKVLGQIHLSHTKLKHSQSIKQTTNLQPMVSIRVLQTLHFALCKWVQFSVVFIQ